MNIQSMIKKLTSTITVIGYCSLVVVAGACSDWDDHYEASTAKGGSGLSLWQQMKQDTCLSDFCAVLEETKVFRMHKKTSVSYADLLNGGQMFTVVAPVNGSFDADSLIALVQTNQGDSVVEKSFVLNHISRSASSLTATGQSVLFMNAKHIEMNADSIAGVPVVEGNCHTANGVLHVVQEPLPYQYNLYEALSDLPDMFSIGALLRQYEEDYFDADASVSSGMVEGVPVYVDSVVIERNRLLWDIGLINAEDSTYWVVAPTTAGWQKAYAEASSYFVYDSSVLKRDSLQQRYATRSLLIDAVYNMTDQKSVNDSLISVPYLNWRKSYLAGRPIYHVFKQPFANGGILSNATPYPCSNGVLYKVDEWPFDPTQTYFTDLWVEAENTWLKYGEDVACTYKGRREVADSISNNGYLQIVPEKNTSNWEMTFRINSCLSGNYDIGVVILPRAVAGLANARPNKFRATIGYVDENGTNKTFTCNNTQFSTDPEKVDTIWVAKDFHFPTSSYGLDDVKATIKIQCSIGALENKKYSREMYLDCIYLRPKNSKAE